MNNVGNQMIILLIFVTIVQFFDVVLTAEVWQVGIRENVKLTDTGTKMEIWLARDLKEVLRIKIQSNKDIIDYSRLN